MMVLVEWTLIFKRISLATLSDRYTLHDDLRKIRTTRPRVLITAGLDGGTISARSRKARSGWIKLFRSILSFKRKSTISYTRELSIKH